MQNLATKGRLVVGALNVKGVTPGTAVASKPLIADANKIVAGAIMIPNSQVASANGAITIKDGIVVITKGTAAAMTLADPTTVTDDFKTLRIISTTAAAHTVSNAAGSGFNAGGAGTDVGTFGGAIGDGMTVMAYGGKWLVVNKTNVTLG